MTNAKSSHSIVILSLNIADKSKGKQTQGMEKSVEIEKWKFIAFPSIVEATSLYAPLNVGCHEQSVDCDRVVTTQSFGRDRAVMSRESPNILPL